MHVRKHRQTFFRNYIDENLDIYPSGATLLSGVWFHMICIWSLFKAKNSFNPADRSIKSTVFLHKTLSMEICISLHPELRFFLVTGYIWSVFSLYLGARTCSRLRTKLLKTWTLHIWQQTSRKFGDIQYICNRYTLRTFVPEVMDAGCRNLDSKITHDFLQKLQCCTFLDQVTYTLRA